MSSDIHQLLNDERVAEPQLADRELWDRAHAVNSEPNEARIQAVLGRIKAIEAAGFPSSDLARAKSVLETLVVPDAPLAIAERGASVAARQAAVQARDAAARALAASLDQVEKTRKAQRSDVASIETFLTEYEKKKAAPQTFESSAPTEVMKPISATPAPAMVAAPPGVWSPDVSIDTPIAMTPISMTPLSITPLAPMAVPAGIHVPPPAKAAPPPPAPKPAPAAPPPAPKPALKAAPVAAKPAPAPRPHVEAPSTMSTGTMRKLSKRRRVRIAPPPKKMEVEVATWGDNTFYTGFDNRIASGGLFVSSLETLPAGHELDLKIDLAGKQFSVRGRVEFTRKDNPSNPDCTSGAGIKLLNLPGDAATAIETFFKEREPLFISPSR